MKRWYALVLLCVTMPGHTHPLSPEASCLEPVRPPHTDVDRWNRFVDEVDAYRACINAFVEQEYAAADAHRAAAERGTERWNSFVRDHLNVPADFPHRKPAAVR
jgi:hypothetical protein